MSTAPAPEATPAQGAALVHFQRFRVSEVTYVLTTRGFMLQLPDEWRVRIKALQLTTVTSTWNNVLRVIVVHFVKKITKSLVLKNAGKLVVGSVLGRRLKATGSAAAKFYDEDEDDDDAVLLLGFQRK